MLGHVVALEGANRFGEAQNSRLCSGVVGLQRVTTEVADTWRMHLSVVAGDRVASLTWPIFP